MKVQGTCPYENCRAAFELDEELVGQSVICPSCGATIVCDQPPPPVAVLPSPARAVVTEDEVLMEGPGIQVTRTRLLLGHQMFQISNIAAVRFYEKPPDKGVFHFAIFMGVAFAAGSWPVWSVSHTGSVIIVLVGLLMIALTIMGMRSLRSTYSFTITTAGMDAEGYSSYDERLVSRAVDAINTAIMKRR